MVGPTFAAAPGAIQNGRVVISPQPPVGEAAMTVSEKALLLQSMAFSPPRDDIEIYYMEQILSRNTFSRATAFAAQYHRGMPATSNVNDSIVVSSTARYYSAAHEMMHIFSQLSRHESHPANLFCDTSDVIAPVEADARDSKRLLSRQQRLLYTRPEALRYVNKAPDWRVYG
jgi:hypothetical protein